MIATRFSRSSLKKDPNLTIHILQELPLVDPSQKQVGEGHNFHHDACRLH